MKGFKTVAVAMVVAAVCVLEQTGFVGIVPDGFEGLALTVVGIIMAYLRTITTTPIGGGK